MGQYAPSSREANLLLDLMRRHPTPLVDTLQYLEHQFAEFLVANFPAAAAVVVVAAAAAAVVDKMAGARADIDVHNSSLLTGDIPPHFHL